ncbi:ABC transporter ATP-binding protein [Candidatus Phytoplasma solani]
MKKPLIIFQDFSFQYYSQKTTTLTNLNITIYEGQKVLIIGKNGSGKSTFLKCINGLIPHSYPGKITGSATIANKNLVKTSIFDLSLEVATVMQDTDNQFVGATVAEDIAFALENDAILSSEIHQQVNQWAKKLNLETFLADRPQSLSEGIKQLVAMAGVLIYNPSILLFDESLSNLDPKIRSHIMTLIKQLHQENKNTILMIEHHLDDILDDSFDRVIVFDKGRIIADMTGEQIITTKTLIQQGIQEPTYINALRCANINNLSTIDHLLNLEQISSKYLTKELEPFANLPLKTPSIKTPFLEEQPKLLELRNIVYQNPYSNYNHHLLDDLSLTLSAGQMVSIIGANGSGKSTLGKIIAGLLTPQKGIIKWPEKHVNKSLSDKLTPQVAFVTQNPHHMLSQKTVFEEVALGLRWQKLSHLEITKRIMPILEICSLTALADWTVYALSFGQKKRLAIASVLVLQPQIIILDDPTAGQDFYHYTKVMLFLQKLNQTGTTVVIITHDTSLILKYTSKTLVLSQGKIIAQGDPVSILTDNLLMQKAELKALSLVTMINQTHLKSLQKINFIRWIIEFNKEHCFK